MPQLYVCTGERMLGIYCEEITNDGDFLVLSVDAEIVEQVQQKIEKMPRFVEVIRGHSVPYEIQKTLIRLVGV